MIAPPPADSGSERSQGCFRLHALNVRPVFNKWAGLCSFAQDKSPFVASEPAADGLFWLAEQGGCGIQTEAAIASATASLINTGELPDNLMARGLRRNDLSPERLR